MRRKPAFVFAVLMLASACSAHPKKSSSGLGQEPRTIAYCELAGDPAAYNHELIRLTGFVTHGFEDFQLIDPNCPPLPYQFSVWLMYSGKAESNTAYCCPGETGQESRPESLVVEGIQVPLLSDSVFQRFTDLLKKEPDTTVHATVVGRFFSGKKQELGGKTSWNGAGHLGCCSLFVVQRVETFEPHTRADVDYTAEAGWYEKEGCKYNSLRWQKHVSVNYEEETAKQAITEQKLADSGERSWAFIDPQRVAIESLKPFYGDEIPTLRKVKTTPVRQVFRWNTSGKSVTIVVTRPYWLSFYAKTNTVAWITTMIKQADCH
jgi:hypothetical protein